MNQDISQWGLLRWERAWISFRDPITVSGAGRGDASQVYDHCQKQPEPVKALDCAGTLLEPYIHQCGEGQEQEAQAWDYDRAESGIPGYRSADPEYQQNEA